MDVETFNPSPFIWAAAIAACVYGLLERFVAVKKHGAEPTFIPMKIPYFGHLIGVMTDQIGYYASVTSKYGQRIYSLGMPGGRLYIVNSPDIIASIMKVRDLSFWFIEASLTRNLGGISDQANALLLENARGDKGENSLVVDGMKATHKAMSGVDLDDMTQVALKRAGHEIKLLAGGKQPPTLELWQWVQHVFSLAVSSGVYGPDNPYEDAVLENGLIEFADYTPIFLSGLPTWVFARKAYKSRERIVAAFRKYFEARSYNRGSELTRARLRVLQDYGVPDADIARFETVNGFGILLNLTPTAFWSIWHVFSDPDLLAKVREEARIVIGDGDFFSGHCDLSKLTELTTVTAVIKESLRFHAAGNAVRMVMEDHLLDNKWMLKRDSYVLMPNKAAHFDDVWGEDKEEFNPFRFDKRSGRKIHPAAFRGFGGGVNLCPGRVFSTKLIASVISALALQYDLKPANNDAQWKHPGHDESSVAIVVARPKEETKVECLVR